MKQTRPTSHSVPDSGKPSPAFRQVAASLLLILITAGVYLPAFRGRFIWDDDSYVEQNPLLHTVSGLHRIWFDPQASPQYYPLVFTSFWLEYHLWGLNPAGHHIVNVLLHGLGAVVLWRVLAAIRLPGAWVAAANFAVHPGQVESVAWITERKNVLCGVFYFAAALSYLRWATATTRPPARKGAPRSGLSPRGSSASYMFSLALFVAALLSKTVACTLPAALLLVLWWKRGRVALRDLLFVTPLLLLGLAFGLLTAGMEQYRVGAQGGEWSLSPLEHVLLAARVICFYAAKLLWPHPLVFIYPRWHIDITAWTQYVYLGLVLGVIGGLWLARRRLGAGPLVGVLFFAGTLFPALGFFNVYPMRFSYVADHFQYLASAGLIALLVAAAAAQLRRLGKRGVAGAPLLAVGVLALLGSTTWRRSADYTHVEGLWRDTLAKNPDAWIAHINLANILSKRDEVADAVDHYKQALRLKPDEAFAHHNCAAALVMLDRFAEAAEHGRAAVQLEPRWPNAHLTLAIALALSNEPREAVQHFRTVLNLEPSNTSAQACLAWILATHPDADVRRPSEAVALAEQAARGSASPSPTILDTLAAAYAANGQFSQAVKTAQLVQNLVAASGPRELLDAVQARLNLYRQGQAFYGWNANSGNMGGFWRPASRPAAP